MDIVILILSAYFLGKQVGKKGYNVYQWRWRHVLSCIFISTLTAGVSLMITRNLINANFSGMLALIGLVIYRYQKVAELPTLKDKENS